MTKHTWKKNDYTVDESHEFVDVFAAENLGSDYHNGPKCETCGFEFCAHCNPEGYETECGTPSIPSDDRQLTGPTF